MVGMKRMFRRSVLAALAQGIDAGGEDTAAFAALGRVDPLLRPFARRSLRQALEAARLTTTIDADGHALRVAWLIAAGAPPEAADDLEGVRAAYGRAPRSPAGRQLWWASSLVGVAVA